MICERLLKEQEMRMRYEYETVLNRRLEGWWWYLAFQIIVDILEQHGQYVQFAQEQIERRYDDNVSCTVWFVNIKVFFIYKYSTTNILIISDVS